MSSVINPLGDYAPMPAARNRIRELRQERNLSLNKLAEMIGSAHPVLSRIERGERRLSLDWMVRIARALQVDPKELLPDSREPSQKAAFLPVQNAIPLTKGRIDLPILGKAQGGAAGVLMIPVEPSPIDYAPRPAQLDNVPDAFGCFVADDSMRPMFQDGQLLYVHPHLPLQRTRGVLVIRHDDRVFVKEYVRRTDAGLLVREYQPTEREFLIPSGDIRAAYRVIGAVDFR